MDFAAKAPQRLARVRVLVFLLAAAISWTLYLHRYAWGVVKPALLAEYPELSLAEVGWLDSAFMAGYSAAQIPTGWLGDALGPRRVLASIVGLWSLALAVVAGAVGFWQLASARLALGATQAGAYPNLGLVTRAWFPPSLRTAVQGAVASFSGRAGGACASLLVATVLMGACGLTWRAALVTVAAGGIVLAGATWVVLRDRPDEHPWVAPRSAAGRPAQTTEPGDGGQAPAAPQVHASQQRESRSSEPAAARGDKPAAAERRSARRTLAALLAATFSATFADNLFANWLPQYLEAEKGMSTVEMGVYASLPLWGGAIGGLVGGALNDLVARLTGSRRWSRSGVALFGQLAAAGLVAGSLTVDDGRGAMLVLAAAKFFIDWGQPTVWGTITDIGGAAAGRIFGLVNMVGTAGALVAGPCMGYLIQQQGFAALFWLVAAVYLLAGLAWLAIDCTKRL